MSKVWLDRLLKKYGPMKKDEMSGFKYSDLISRIVSHNAENISRAITRQSSDKWTKALNKISTEEKRFIIPDLSDVLPKRAPHILKSAQNGKVISQTLRDNLTANLRESLNQFTPKTGEQTYITRRGKNAGKINPKVIEEFKKSITETFQNYVSKPKRGESKMSMPSNIENIAVTEIRTTVNTTKRIYIDSLREKNSDLRLRKRWLHNDSLSKNPDNFHWGHKKLHGKTIDYDDMFEVKQYKLFKGKHIFTGIVYMFHPHSEEGGAENNIGCHCDWEILAMRGKA